MFSLLSKMTGLYSDNSISQDKIDDIIDNIKRLSRNPLDSNIKQILSLMKKYYNCLEIQRVSCHTLSNLSMQMPIALKIVEFGGFKFICNALRQFETDHKICWLGSSSLWNLARPSQNRYIIGKQATKLLLKIMQLHQYNETVMNTTMGALSNLCLLSDIKDVLGQPKSMTLITKTITYFINNPNIKSIAPVLISGAGLIANLAVSDQHANSLLEYNTLDILLKILNLKILNDIKGDNMIQIDETLYRNACAALNNIVCADKFLDEFLAHYGIETVFQFLNINKNELFTRVLATCLSNIDVDINKPTTSHHLASFHGKIDVLKTIIKNKEIDLNEEDKNKRTCLDYAIQNDHVEIAQFLSKCGAINKGNVEEISKEMESAMDNGLETFNRVYTQNSNAIQDTLHQFPTDICSTILKFNSNIDMLCGMNEY